MIVSFSIDRSDPNDVLVYQGLADCNVALLLLVVAIKMISWGFDQPISPRMVLTYHGIEQQPLYYYCVQSALEARQISVLFNN